MKWNQHQMKNWIYKTYKFVPKYKIISLIFLKLRIINLIFLIKNFTFLNDIKKLITLFTHKKILSFFKKLINCLFAFRLKILNDLLKTSKKLIEMFVNHRSKSKFSFKFCILQFFFIMKCYWNSARNHKNGSLAAKK